MEEINKNKIANIPQLICIDKIIPNSLESKKSQFSKDICIVKKRNNSAEIKIKKNDLIYIKPFKKVWPSMEYKFKQTKKEPKNFDEHKNFIKLNGIDEHLNYLYLKKLKEKRDSFFDKEFEQYKYTLSFTKRIELSKNPKDEINMPLKDYFQNLLLLIINEPNKFNVEDEIRKFNVDFDKFGILLHPNKNLEIFYCYMIDIFLNVYQDLNNQENEPEYYMSFLKDFIKEQDLTPIKCLVFVWILLTINEENDNFQFQNALQTYNSILRSNKKDEYFCECNIKKKTNIFNFQKIIEDNKLFIEKSYFGKGFNILYDFCKKVILSPLLNEINSSIDEFNNVLKIYDYTDIKIDNIILFPMLIRKGIDDGFTKSNLGLIFINSIPLNIYPEAESSSNVLLKIHNYFFLYVTILHEQNFHYLRFIFNKLDSDINQDSPKSLFLNLTNDIKKNVLLLKEGDSGDKGEIIIFGDNNLSLKQIFYFSNINNYNKPLSQIEKEVKKLSDVIEIVEDDINNSFFKNILSNEEKYNLCIGNFDKEKSKHLYIKSKMHRRFCLPYFNGRDKIKIKKYKK